MSWPFSHCILPFFVLKLAAMPLVKWCKRWCGKKENFTWYTQGDILNIVYKEDSSYGNGYDVDKFRFVLTANIAHIYELSSSGQEQGLFGVFTRISGGTQQTVAHAFNGSWMGEVQDKGGKHSITL